MMEIFYSFGLVALGVLAGLILDTYIPWQKLFRIFRIGRGKSELKQTVSSDPDPFITESARVIGQVCKVDVPLNEEERVAFEKGFFALFPEASEFRDELLSSFEEEELRGRNLAEGIAQFYWDFSSRKEELRSLLYFAIEMSLADGKRNVSEEHITEVMARTFGIHTKEYQKMEAQVLEGHSRRVEMSDGQRLSKTEQRLQSERTRRSEQTLRTLSQSKYYRVLGLPSGASASQIKSAYRKLAKENHPDLNGVQGSDGGRRFREIQIAYEALQKDKLVS